MDKEYTVKPGDTLYGISKQFGVSVNDLKKANDMTDNVVTLGSVMIIPDTSVSTYTVKSGDSIYSIARNFGVTTDEIINANDLNGDMLMIGEILTIPSSGSNTSFINYKIKKGDNLYDLASTYNTTVYAIKSLNNLKGSDLSIGEVIKIPTVLVDEVSIFKKNYKEYTVKPGDNLYSIAESFGVSVDDIKKVNKLDNNNLTIGEVLLIGIFIPDSVLGLSCYGNDSDLITYIVKKGDDLYSIASKYSTSVNSIKEINDLKSDDLDIGQILKIRKGS